MVPKLAINQSAGRQPMGWLLTNHNIWVDCWLTNQYHAGYILDTSWLHLGIEIYQGLAASQMSKVEKTSFVFYRRVIYGTVEYSGLSKVE